MYRFLAFLAEFGRKNLGFTQDAFHDDTLRANQGDRASNFSFWRSLVS